jgi:hypothetical protein
VGEYNVTALGQVIVVENAFIGTGQKFGQQRFARKEWPAAVVLSFVLDQVESEQDASSAKPPSRICKDRSP